MLVLWQCPHAILRAQKIRFGRVAAATGNAEIAGYSPRWIGLFNGFVGAVPVEHPLFYIAMHVVESPGIRRSLTNQSDHRHWRRIGARRRVLQVRRGERIARVGVGGRSSASRVLPFRLRGKAILL